MFERGELVLIPFPFSDLSAAKRRAAPLLTGHGYGDFIALAVTSRGETDNAIALDPKDLVRGSLPLASWIASGGTGVRGKAAILQGEIAFAAFLGQSPFARRVGWAG